VVKLGATPRPYIVTVTGETTPPGPVYRVTATAGFTVLPPTTITSLPEGSGFVKVDDLAITTPQIFNWMDGETHKLEALSPVSGIPGIQYVWVSWTDPNGEEQTHTYTTSAAYPTVTANYKTQYYITVVSSYGSPTSSEWVDERQDYATSVTSPDGDYKCDGFKIDGGELQLGTSYTFTNVQAPHTIEYVWNAPNPPPEPSHPVGGVLAPANKLAILSPYLAPVGLVGGVTVVFAIRKRRRELCMMSQTKTWPDRLHGKDVLT
jgi:hypothetical protein